MNRSEILHEGNKKEVKKMRRISNFSGRTMLKILVYLQEGAGRQPVTVHQIWGATRVNYPTLNGCLTIMAGLGMIRMEESKSTGRRIVFLENDFWNARALLGILENNRGEIENGKYTRGTLESNYNKEI